MANTNVNKVKFTCGTYIEEIFLHFIESDNNIQQRNTNLIGRFYLRQSIPLWRSIHQNSYFCAWPIVQNDELDSNLNVTVDTVGGIINLLELFQSLDRHHKRTMQRDRCENNSDPTALTF